MHSDLILAEEQALAFKCIGNRQESGVIACICASIWAPFPIRLPAPCRMLDVGALLVILCSCSKLRDCASLQNIVFIGRQLSSTLAPHMYLHMRFKLDMRTNGLMQAFKRNPRTHTFMYMYILYFAFLALTEELKTRGSQFCFPTLCGVLHNSHARTNMHGNENA
jgi:hypothetical protein